MLLLAVLLTDNQWFPSVLFFLTIIVSELLLVVPVNNVNVRRDKQSENGVGVNVRLSNSSVHSELNVSRECQLKRLLLLLV